MSTELNQYLNELSIYMIRLVDGTTIIAKIIDEDTNTFLIQHPHEVHLHEGTRALDMSIHDWMYLSDDTETIIQKDKVISYSEANILTKTSIQRQY